MDTSAFAENPIDSPDAREPNQTLSLAIILMSGIHGVIEQNEEMQIQRGFLRSLVTSVQVTERIRLVGLTQVSVVFLRPSAVIEGWSERGSSHRLRFSFTILGYWGSRKPPRIGVRFCGFFVGKFKEITKDVRLS